MNILIAEDNPAVAEGLAYCLRKAGHTVTLAGDGQAALTALGEARYELLVLDYGLPKVHGAQVLRAVRARADYLPVMLFSALDDAETRLAALGLKVDAVMNKPFALADFERNVGAIERRFQPASRVVVSFGPITCDIAQGTVLLDGTPLELPAEERTLLELLVQRTGGLVGNDEIARLIGASMGGTGRNPGEACADRLQARFRGKSMHLVKVRGLGCCLSMA